jgi:hypothetical protein
VDPPAARRVFGDRMLGKSAIEGGLKRELLPD